MTRIARILLILAGLSGVGPSAHAATYTVTSTAPVGAGSLNDALIAANSNPGLDTVEFNISGPGPHVINKSGYLIFDELVLDGYTQPGAAQNTGGENDPWNGLLQIVIDGNGTVGDLLSVAGGNVEVRGLAFVNGTGYAIRGSTHGDHRVFGCLVGWLPDGTTAPNANGIWVEGDANEIGGTAAWQRNVIHEDLLVEGNSSLIRGNIFRLAPDGVTTASGGTEGIDLIGDGNILGSLLGGSRNVIATDIRVEGNGNRIRRNRVGTDYTGTLDKTTGYIGISIYSGDDNLIGGSAFGGVNHIGGFQRGIYVGSAATNTRILRNNIGIGVGGADIGNWEYGVLVEGNGTQVGGPGNNDGNWVRNNGAGVVVDGAATGVTIRRNEIADNYNDSQYAVTTLDIDLGRDGLTLNDPGDADTGANGLLNFPVVTDIEPVGTDFVVHVEYEGAVGQSYALEVFSTSICNPEGYGGGETLLHTENALIPGGGLYGFSFAIPQASMPEGSFVTATATDAGGSTSEFSACLEVTLLRVLTLSDDGYGSLRRALTVANASAGPDTIQIIPAGPIQLQTPLPAITDQLRLRGSSLVLGTTLLGDLLPANSDGLVIRAASSWIESLNPSQFDGDGFVLDAPLIRLRWCNPSKCGIGVDQFSGSVDMDRCVLTDNDVGVWLRGDGSRLEYSGANGGNMGIIVDADDVIIGDTAFANDCNGNGMWVRSGAQRTLVVRSAFSRNQGTGILLEGDDSIIGGEITSWNTPANDISLNGGPGIRVQGTNNVLRANRIYSNGGLGIDLGSTGVAPNDPLDADSGPNDYLNFPELTAVEHFGPGCPLRITGSYHGLPNTDVTIDLYHSPVCDSSGFGEGQYVEFGWIIDVTTDGAGNASFQKCLDSNLPVGTAFSSQATVGNKSSELGNCISSVVTAVEQPDAMPSRVALYSNQPNPFQGRTTVAFDIAEADTPVRIEIFDLRGRRVRLLEDRSYGPGRHTLDWDRRDSQGARLAAGVYVLHLKAGAAELSRKVVLLD